MTNDLPRSDHLLLLVGGNPLPSAVAGRLLARPGAVVSLVHSGGPRGTLALAQKVSAWLSQHDKSLTRRFVSVEESNPVSIYQAVQAELRAVRQPSVGLNYTGGTKAMAVHAYRAVEHELDGKGTRPTCSYLDARALQMVFDPEDIVSASATHREHVGRRFQMTLGELLDLHGWQPQQPLRPQPALPLTARRLAEAHADEQAFQDWSAWRRDVWKPCQEGRQPIPLPAAVSLRLVADAMRQELPLDSQGRAPRGAIQKGTHGADLYEWLDGKWLECATLAALQACPAELGLHGCGWGLEDVTRDGRTIKFEIDAIALRGYQLFGFSCSNASDRKREYKELKLKLFEAFIRARQLGGDEARVALVCCREDPSDLEDEVCRDIDPEGRTRVFGRKDLANLTEALAKWVRQQSGEEVS